MQFLKEHVNKVFSVPVFDPANGAVSCLCCSLAFTAHTAHTHTTPRLLAGTVLDIDTSRNQLPIHLSAALCAAKPRLVAFPSTTPAEAPTPTPQRNAVLVLCAPTITTTPF